MWPVDLDHVPGYLVLPNYLQCFLALQANEASCKHSSGLVTDPVIDGLVTGLMFSLPPTC